MIGTTAHLALPEAARDAVIDDVRAYGALRVETGAFLLASRRRPGQVSHVALLGVEGVERRRGLFVVTAPVIDKLFAYAEGNDLLVRSLVHSHEHEAFMSVTDKAGTIRTPGFIAAVIPSFNNPPGNPASWGWWNWTPPAWTTSPAAQLTAGPVTVVRCDGTCTMLIGSRDLVMRSNERSTMDEASRGLLGLRRRLPRWSR
jgi:hypothetical protein